MKLKQQTFMLLSIPLAFEIIFVVVLVQALHKTEQQFLEEAHNREISICVNRMMRCMLQSVTQLGTRYLVKKDSVQISKISDLLADIQEQRKVLNTLVGDDVEKKKQFESFNSSLETQLVTVDEFQRLMQGNHDMEAIQVLRKLNKLLSTLNNSGAEIIESYERQGEIRKQAIENSRKTVRMIIAFGAVFNVILVGVLGWWTVRNTISRLQVLMKNNENLAARKSLSAPLTGNDEIAELDNTFHTMAKTLEDARLKEREFISMISHDIRSPLAGLQLTVELFAGETFGEVTDKGQTALTKAGNSIRRILDITGGLLELDKIESGTFVLNQQPVQLDQLVSEAVAMVQNLADEKQITIDVETDKLTASVDQTQILRVIVNLLSNAIKFSNQGQKVSITMKSEGNSAFFKVIDTGRGIPRDKLGTVFERYGQVEAEDATVKKGTGLGLPICMGLVNAHRGAIGVDSEPGGEGGRTVFWFTLPTTATEKTQSFS